MYVPRPQMLNFLVCKKIRDDSGRYWASKISHSVLHVHDWGKCRLQFNSLENTIENFQNTFEKLKIQFEKHLNTIEKKINTIETF